jgi:acyl carrier protein
MDRIAMNREEIYQAMRSLVADSLALKEDEIQPQCRLTDDLGADSLDFIDIIFGMEKKFGIKLRDGELDFILRLDFSSPQVMRQGYLTLETIERLKKRLPALEQVQDPAKVTPAQLFSLITIETLCLMVEEELGKR